LNSILEYILDTTFNEQLIVAAELLLIGIFVYAIVTFLEGTRGERLFRGMIFVLVAGSLVLNLVVKTFDMERIAFLYNGFLIAILIIAVIAFQPEIRRGLIRIGQTRFFASSPQQLSRSVEEIITAVSQMAAERTGAIIVIPQQVALGEFIETGVRVDAKVTSELIRTIFHAKTVLHDMAMVIQADRIVAGRSGPVAAGRGQQPIRTPGLAASGSDRRDHQFRCGRGGCQRRDRDCIGRYRRQPDPQCLRGTASPVSDDGPCRGNAGPGKIGQIVAD
jgi:DNA integrity scanning protein DisA with diadenylate cyclase activity